MSVLRRLRDFKTLVGAELDGGAANYGGLNTAAQIFPPQMNKAGEVGLEWELFDRHLLATGWLSSART
ncbi:MAG: hypothetical protein U1E25_16085 [Methylocystis sp.]